MTTDQLPLSTADTQLAELSALRDEVARLRPIAEAAEYFEGPAGCVEEGGDCDEDKPAGAEWCSHVTVRHATSAHVIAHTRLAGLIAEAQRQLLDLLGADDVLAGLREGLYAIVVDFQNNVDVGADQVTGHPVYVTAVEETDGPADEY